MKKEEKTKGDDNKMSSFFVLETNAIIILNFYNLPMNDIFTLYFDFVFETDLSESKEKTEGEGHKEMKQENLKNEVESCMYGPSRQAIDNILGFAKQYTVLSSGDTQLELNLN
ncbi:hypothetical protein [Prolixibacter sp. SD074]|uniref:hypothetical protein n=1 Tax=Prolixibacter sp. SD074 TaxID=2652391 RepID=UPI00126B2B30|nr:hypothetical protein [Prolixibacter sp. SD074]GET29580.1 hypothetical protein SD074_17820 [Prolixibacter sp. SD074]